MTSDQRVRVVISRYGDSIVGGAEIAARALTRRICAQGWQTEVYTTCAQDAWTWSNAFSAGQSQDGPVNVRRFPVDRPRHPWVFGQLSRLFFRIPPAWRPERLWLTAQGPHVPQLLAGLDPPFSGVTLFFQYLYYPTVYGACRVPGLRLLIPTAHDEPALRLRSVGEALLSMDGLWFHTEEEKALVHTLYPSTKNIPSEVGAVGMDVPSDIDENRFRIQHGLGKRSYIIYGGRVAPGKGMDELTATMHHLRSIDSNIVLVVMGEAGEIIAGSDNVVPVGRLSNDARWDALAGALATVVPSIYESLSMLALEGWALGKPALLNGASTVLSAQARRSGAALVYHGSADLAEKVTQLATDTSQCITLGQAGSLFVQQNYQWDVVMERWDNLVAAASAYHNGNDTA